MRNPASETVYAQLPMALRGAEPSDRSINRGEFRAGPVAREYAEAGVEIQIADFRYWCWKISHIL